MLVSIIIPVYNVAPYIEDCLRSVMRQTYLGEMECLIVDDCGTDESVPIAERMVVKYDGPIRFEILHHEHNRGLSAARNTGMEIAAGDYIFFIDGDDEITEDCLEKMMSVVNKCPEVELVQGVHMITHRDGKGRLGLKEIRMNHACTNDEVRCCFCEYHQVHMAAWNKLIKHSLIVDNKLSFIEGRLCEDIPWTFYLLKYVKNAFFLADVTYHYLIRPGSICRGTTKDTIVIHRLKGYHDIVTNLTPGYEKQEIEHWSPLFIYYFLHLSYHIPELLEDLKIHWHYAREFREFKLCGALAICYVFRKTKWLGRIVYSFAKRVSNPGLILKDFARLWSGIVCRIR